MIFRSISTTTNEIEAGMILAIAEVISKNPQFCEALNRTFVFREMLQSRLESVDLSGACSLMGFVIGDCPVNTFRVNKAKGADEAYQAIVGYDVAGDYPPSRDGEVVSLLAGWVRRAVTEAEGYAAKRTELLDIVDTWEKESLAAIAARPVAG